MIGIEDFKPELISAGSFFKRPVFEPFYSLTQRASRWLNSHCVDYFLNAQSIDIKIKSASKLETRNCTNIEHGHYLQFLRIVYCKLLPRTSDIPSSSMVKQSSNESTNQQDIIQLYSKVFVATKIDHPLDSMQQRIYNWLHLDNNNQKNVCIIGAETINVYGKHDDEKVLEKKTSESFYGNRLGSLNTYTFKAIRLYYCQLPINGDDDNFNENIAKYCHYSKTFSKKKFINKNNNSSKTLQRNNSSRLKSSHSNSFKMNEKYGKDSTIHHKGGFIKHLKTQSQNSKIHSKSCNCM
ncbi:hypothetical protein BLA29_007087 [Euroglyphus maynei]|uniref:Uncharacterized protein n=1 Tax=Euroglyphus maynei TaxID=6958 RepID=A0A1Y3B0G4_EURMA|nr:hypothetical protein BLA29_007087 [Euroglyphus maynei]